MLLSISLALAAGIKSQSDQIPVCPLLQPSDHLGAGMNTDSVILSSGKGDGETQGRPHVCLTSFVHMPLSTQALPACGIPGMRTPWTLSFAGFDVMFNEIARCFLTTSLSR